MLILMGLRHRLDDNRQIPNISIIGTVETDTADDVLYLAKHCKRELLQTAMAEDIGLVERTVAEGAGRPTIVVRFSRYMDFFRRNPGFMGFVDFGNPYGYKYVIYDRSSVWRTLARFDAALVRPANVSDGIVGRVLEEVVTGFKVKQGVRIGFDLDLGKLADALAAITQWSSSEPDFSVSFTVKDPAAVRDSVLQSAARNARRQADVLCAASDVKLGKLVSISYTWSEIDFRSNVTYAVSRTVTSTASLSMPLDRNAVAKMRPDDISVSDSATFVWEIE